MEPVVLARNLVKRYGETLAVDGIDLAIYQGECFGLLGPNGAGKTFTLKMASCVSPVTSGVLLLGGKSVATDPRGVKALLGVVPQEDNLDTDLTVLENLLTYARYYDMDSTTAIAVTALVPYLNSLNSFFTLFITPMWFFSGVFFPLHQLPPPISTLAWFLPLTSATRLVRGLAFGEMDWALLGSFLVMMGFLAFFMVLALHLMRRLLIK